MSRRQHYPRFDTSVCPDADECARLYHGIGGPDAGDSCECCNAIVRAEDWQWTPAKLPNGEVLYWRLSDGARDLGTVIKLPDGWRATCGVGTTRRTIGVFPSWQRARREVRIAVRQAEGSS